MKPAAIPSILKKIIVTKKHEITRAQQLKSFPILKQEALTLLKDKTHPRRGFAAALRHKQSQGLVAVIAEIKKASPSKGIISANFNPSRIAQQYQHAGAACLSVLTDEAYFQGHARYLHEAKQACDLPILRKDFMIEAYQIYESYVMGADCVLLIVACLDKETLHDLHGIACELGMDVLIEVHTQDELEQALSLPKSSHNIYGINNRDLNTFTTDLNTSTQLKAFIDAHIPNLVIENLADDTHYTDDAHNASSKDYLLVTESGIHSAEDMLLMQNNGINCFLIGEQFMKTDNPGDTLQSLLHQVNERSH